MTVSKTKLLLKYRNELLDIHRYALEAIKPENLIRNNVKVSNNILTIKTRIATLDYDLSKTKIHVIGGGKSVMSMALGLADIAGRSNIQEFFSHGCLSIPFGLESRENEETLASIRVECNYGSRHNVPDQASVDATFKILEAVSDACENDRSKNLDSLFIVLISGGGSACLTSPKSVSLAKKLEIMRFLVQKGATIVDLNKVRSYYSNIKGGGLAKYILSKNSKSKIISLILSDIIGDPTEYIASGPTYLVEEDTLNYQREQAYHVLSQYGYPIDSVEFQKKSVDTTNIPSFNHKTRIVNHIIGNNQIAVDAAIHKARFLGYRVTCLGSDLQGSTRSVMNRLIEPSENQFKNPNSAKILIIGGGEATVAREEGENWGKGGRAQELALEYLISQMSRVSSELNEKAIDMLLAGTTDGQDGPTDVGACLVSYAEMIDEIPKVKLKLDDALAARANHDSYNFWKTFCPNSLIKTGLTGTNVMDLYMYSLNDIKSLPSESSKL